MGRAKKKWKIMEKWSETEKPREETNGVEKQNLANEEGWGQWIYGRQ